MYAMLGTCPDIAYAVGALSQYSGNPGKDHLAAVNQVFRYLNYSKDYKLVYNGKAHDNDFTGYSDSNWAGDPHDHCLISGFVFKIVGAAISWSSKKQSLTALSSMKESIWH
jgi:hypothetical protein